jgi:hypothetical protein
MVQVTDSKNIPTHHGFWFRADMFGRPHNVVNVYENVPVEGDQVLPLAWYEELDGFEGRGRWVPVMDDGRWIREVRTDDVPAAEVESLKERLEKAEKDCELWGVGVREFALIVQGEITEWRNFVRSVAVAIHGPEAEDHQVSTEDLPGLLEALQRKIANGT